MTCPSSLILSQAFPGSASAELQAHLQSCPACAAQWGALAQVRAAAQKLPYVTPDKGRREEVRKRLLAAAARQPVDHPSLGRWGTWLGLAAATLCILLGARLLWERTQGNKLASHWRAVVQSPSAGSFVHERTGGDEWVRLLDGTLHIEVQPLQAGERFRVVCGDSEVEVRGTAFETVVERDHLRRVSVLHGVVEVRPYGRPAVLLRAGQRWQSGGAPQDQSTDTNAAHTSQAGTESLASGSTESPAGAPSAAAAPVATEPRLEKPISASPPASRFSGTAAIRRLVPAASSPERKVPPAKPPASVRSAAAEARPVSSAQPAISAAELAFMEGWTALRQGRHQTAADCFARAAEQGDVASSTSLLEDARFWRAVSLARSGQRPLAIAALREFLRQHPAAARAGEASAILGWQLLRDGQLDAAQRCFEIAENDSHAPIRENARSGLAAVAARR